LWLFVIAAVSAATAVQVPDGTPVPVRLLRPIDSQTAKVGDPLTFIVSRDVVVDGTLVIRRGARVFAEVVKARPAHWSSLHGGKLEFRFSQTTAVDGRALRLRASLVPREKDRVLVDRDDLHHSLQWASEADAFNAYVDGTYDF